MSAPSMAPVTSEIIQPMAPPPAALQRQVKFAWLNCTAIAAQPTVWLKEWMCAGLQRRKSLLNCQQQMSCSRARLQSFPFCLSPEGPSYCLYFPRLGLPEEVLIPLPLFAVSI